MQRIYITTAHETQIFQNSCKDNVIDCGWHQILTLAFSKLKHKLQNFRSLNFAIGLFFRLFVSIGWKSFKISFPHIVRYFCIIARCNLKLSSLSISNVIFFENWSIILVKNRFEFSLLLKSLAKSKICFKIVVKIDNNWLFLLSDNFDFLPIWINTTLQNCLKLCKKYVSKIL